MRLRKDVLLPLAGLLLLTAACGSGAKEQVPSQTARLTAAHDELPQATSTTAEQISTTTTEAPTTTVPPTTTTTAPPPPPPTTAAPPPPPPTTARPAPTTVPAPPPTAAPASTSSTYYANCDAARAAGAAPLHEGDPGYRSGLDRDHDGIACE